MSKQICRTLTDSVHASTTPGHSARGSRSRAGARAPAELIAARGRSCFWLRSSAACGSAHDDRSSLNRSAKEPERFGSSLCKRTPWPSATLDIIRRCTQPIQVLPIFTLAGIEADYRHVQRTASRTEARPQPLLSIRVFIVMSSLFRFSDALTHDRRANICAAGHLVYQICEARTIITVANSQRVAADAIGTVLYLNHALFDRHRTACEQ